MDKKYISGIHNYCDRWCEYCKFTDRCSVYAMDVAHRKAELDWDQSGGKLVEDRDQFWDNLKGVLDETMDQIFGPKENRNQWDLPDEEPDAEEMEDFRKTEEERDNTLDADPLFLAAKKYTGQMDKIKPETLAAEKDDKAQHERQISVDDFRLNRSREIIRWYQYQIQVKLRRALLSQLDEQEDWDVDMEGFQKDSDGSAKVALIGIDRSIGAWGTLMKYQPEYSDQFTNIIVLLTKLRAGVEKQFPEARNFKRPGFDD